MNHCIANFLYLRHSHGNRTNTSNNPGYMIVIFRALEGINDVAGRSFFLEHDLGYRIVGNVFDKRLFQVHFENRLAGNAWLIDQQHHNYDQRIENDDGADDRENANQNFFHLRRLNGKMGERDEFTGWKELVATRMDASRSVY